MGPNGTGTPCIRVCKMDSQCNLCTGCFRTLGEITDWLKYTEDQKAKIISMLDIRRELLCQIENVESE